jgi:UDP-2,3-diacylglucosamine pyrophosphatase LpxH
MANPGLTDDQIREAFKALETHKTKVAAAKALGLAPGTFNNRILVGTTRGYSPDHDMNHIAPEGFALLGTSTLYGPDGEIKNQWVKTTRDAQRQQEALEAIIESMKSELPPSVTVAPPERTNNDLLSVYPVGDHHFGCLVWGEETGGDNYNTEIAEKLLCGAMQYLVDQSPECDEAAILILGDFLHFNNSNQETVKGGHTLDSDSRFQKVIRAAINAIRYQVRAALEKHHTVRLIIELGNHDADIMKVLMETFYAHFDNEPRVVVDRSPRNVHVFEWGFNLIGTHHGDKIKMDRIPLVIATDFPEMWGRTKFRAVHTGHVHHDHIREYPGLTTESHRVLAPKDEFAGSGGWRSRQSMKNIIYHKKYGEVARNTVTPEMLKNE